MAHGPIKVLRTREELCERLGSQDEYLTNYNGTIVLMGRHGRGTQALLSTELIADVLTTGAVKLSDGKHGFELDWSGLMPKRNASPFFRESKLVALAV